MSRYMSEESLRVLIQLGQEANTLKLEDFDGDEIAFKSAVKSAVEARNKVIMNYQDMIYKSAKHYCYFNPALTHDCAQACIITLIEKFDQFDLRLNIKWGTWAFNWVRQACGCFYYDNVSMIRIPRNTSQSTPETLRRMRQATRCTQGSKPTTEGATRTGGKKDLCVQDTLLDESEHHTETVERLDEGEAVNRVLSHLDHRLRTVLVERTDGKTLKQVGRVMGVSKERTRQLEMEAKVKFVEWAGRVSKPMYERLLHGVSA